MNYRCIIYLQDNKPFIVDDNIEGLSLGFNDSFIRMNLSKASKNPDDIKSFEFIISGKYLNISLTDVKHFQHIKIRGAKNSECHINQLVTEGVKLHLTNMIIENMQTRDDSLFFGDCKINNLKYDIESFMENVLNKEYVRKKNFKEKVEFRRCQVNLIEIYSSIRDLVISESVVNRLTFFTDKPRSIDLGTLILTSHSTLTTLQINANINELILHDSEIRKVFLNKDIIIKKLNMIRMEVISVHQCSIDNFVEKTADTWNLVKKSFHGKNKEEYFQACYEISAINGKDANPFINWLYDKSVGYGYKPSNAVSFIIATILAFASVYSFVDIFVFSAKGYILSFTEVGFRNVVDQLANNIYLSGITLTTTGFGDVYPNCFLSELIAIFESCVGVSLLSLVMYSLGKRHFDNW